ncbi:MAG: hypothetical protein HYX74_03560 [Acidobacteria bacterium]|nr:hypothetical protein [Acidobacteriota bacterium]
MKNLFAALGVGAAILASLHADRVFSTFDPAADPLTRDLNLRFDTNSVATDDFFSPTLLFSADGKRCFVNFPGSASVVVFDPSTMAAVATLPVGDNPALMAMTPDKSTIAVANIHLADKIPVNKRLGSVSLVDVETLQVRTVPFEKVDFGLGSNIVFTPDGSVGFVASTGSDEIVRFRLPDGAEVPPRLKLPGGSRPARLTMAHNGSFFTVVNVADQQFSTTPDSVAIVDVAEFKVRATVSPKEPHDFLATHNITLSRDDRMGIIGDDASKGQDFDVAYVFDTSTGEVLKRIELLGTATGFTALTPDGTRFVVVDRFDVSFISSETLELVAQLSPTNVAFGTGTNIVFTADSSFAYLADPFNNRVYGVDLTTYAPTVEVPVGAGREPMAIALTPDEQRLAVLNFQANTIDFIGKTFGFVAPRFYSGGDRFTGVVLANTGRDPANVRLQARHSSGAVFEDIDITEDVVEIVNPASVDLEPGQQIVGAAGQFFENDPAENPIDGWISIDSTDGDLIGSLVIGDFSGRRLTAANMDRQGASSFVIPIVRQNDDFSTEIVLANSNLKTADVQVRLKDAEGNLVVEIPIAVPAGGVTSGKLVSDDPEVPDLLPEAAGLEGAYLEVTSSLPVSGLAFYETSTSLSALPALKTSSDPIAAGVELVAPQVALLAGFKTVLSCANPTDQAADLVLTLLGDNGQTLAGPKGISLAPAQATATDLAEFFALSGSAPVSGWLKVSSNNARIAAAVEIFSFDGRTLSTFPLAASSGSDFHFAHLAQTDGFITSIALANPNPQPAQAVVDLLATDGNLLGSASVLLAPDGHFSNTLASLFGAVSAAGARIRVRSSARLAGLEFFFHPEMETLAVVLPQSVR